MSEVKFTPLLGGCDEGPVCSLLEIGGTRLLLDCGSYSHNINKTKLLEISNDLVANGGIDAVIISHADVIHLGGLPLICGKNTFGGVPVICTNPVYKFGQMVLYDLYLNTEMEGIDPNDNNSKYHEKLYDMDDIDKSLSNVHTVRYSQTITLAEVTDEYSFKHISFCAYPSGRTLGGSIWRIRYGSTDVVYAMDINLKREIVVDGAAAALDSLPKNPALLIVEGGCISRNEGLSGRRKKGDESSQLIQTILETVRDVRTEGNVLIPCESAARALEIMQILGKYWFENKLAQYHLIFLSHMAHNILEFARCHLEWASDLLSADFFNGKQNPFELPALNLARSVREIERLYPGPKVVIATDSSLSCGLSKELLLKWGGDPRSRIIFTDESDRGSFAYEIRSKVPPIVVTVNKPQRVELTGEELANYQREVEKKRRDKEDIETRERREKELSLLASTRGIMDDEERYDDAEIESIITESNDSKKKRSIWDISLAKSKKSKSSKTSKFIEPQFPMFQSKDVNLEYSEFGASISDLVFPDNMASTSNTNKAKSDSMTSPRSTQALISQNDEIDKNEIPWKLVAVSMRTQLTCSMKDVSLGGRAELKSIKTLLSKINPIRVAVIRGSENDCENLMSTIKATSVECYSPRNNESVAFKVQGGSVKLSINPSFLPTVRRVKGIPDGENQEVICQLYSLNGRITESETTTDGVRIVKWKGGIDEENTEQQLVNEEVQEKDVIGNDGDILPDEYENSEMQLDISPCTSSLVSIGEVTLNSLKQQIESNGIAVEYRIGSEGAMLVLLGQVLIKKDVNNFIIEGPPVPTFWEARKALYQQFSFV